MIDLKEFIGETIVPRDIEHKGKTKTFYIAEISSEEAEDLFVGVSKTDDRKNKGLRAKMIAAALRDEKGGKAFSAEEANKLPLWLVTRLQEEILDVNGMNEQKKDEAKKE